MLTAPSMNLTNRQHAPRVRVRRHVVGLDDLEDADAQEADRGAEQHVPGRERNWVWEPRKRQQPLVEQDDADGDGHP